MLLDLTDIGTMLNCGLGDLVALANRLETDFRTVGLCCLQPDVRRAIETLRLDLLFDVFPTEAEALRLLRENP